MSWLSRLSLAQAVRWALLWPVLLAVGVGSYFLWDRMAGGEWIIITARTPTPPTFSELLPTLVVALVIVGPPIGFLSTWRLVRPSA